MESNGSKFAELNDQLQRLLNRKQYLEGWMETRDVAFDLQDYANVITRIEEVKREMGELNRKYRWW